MTSAASSTGASVNPTVKKPLAGAMEAGELSSLPHAEVTAMAKALTVIRRNRE
jgi:hypothetical protein